MPILKPMILFNTREAAEVLGLKPATLEVWRWVGRGPRYVKAGRCVRYRQEDLEEYISSRTFDSTTEAEGRA